MKTAIMLSLCMVLVISMARADDIQTSITQGGDDQLTIGPDYNNGLFNNTSIPAVTSTGGSGGSPTINKYYDVILQTTTAIVRPGENATATANITFMLQSPPIPQDGVLEYSIIDPTGQAASPSRIIVREGTHNIKLNYPVPIDAKEGVWKFTMTWTTSYLDPMTSSDTFQVVKNQNTTLYIIVGVIILALGGILIASRNNE